MCWYSLTVVVKIHARNRIYLQGLLEIPNKQNRSHGTVCFYLSIILQRSKVFIICWSSYIPSPFFSLVVDLEQQTLKQRLPLKKDVKANEHRKRKLSERGQHRLAKGKNWSETVENSINFSPETKFFRKGCTCEIHRVCQSQNRENARMMKECFLPRRSSHLLAQN